MKKYLLTTIFIAAITAAITAKATATNDLAEDRRVLKYSINKNHAVISKSHVQNFVGGNIDVNLAEKTITMFMQDSKVCPVGLACTMELKGLRVELPIISSKASQCKVTHTARQDKRPVDGLFQQITVEEINEASSCKFITAPINLKSSYTTIYVNRMTGLNSVSTSSFGVTLNEVLIVDSIQTIQSYQLADGQFGRGFDKRLVAHDGDLTITDSHVEMEISYVVQCPMNAACDSFAGTYKKFKVSLPITRRSAKGCTEVVEASAQVKKSAHGFATIETLKVVNPLSGFGCGVPLNSLIDAKYELVDPSAMFPIKEAQFSFSLRFANAAQ